jgi:DeoR family transcriptional regulator, fructose operon transcriptional repressor
MATFADQRRLQIMACLESQQRIVTRDLSASLGVSEASVRKDLCVLEELGLLKRIQNGAVAMPHFRLEKDHVVKMNLNRDRKERIGQAAASLIQTGECVILDAGTTPLQVAKHICTDLRDTGDLTVYTPSLSIFRELGACPGIHLVLLGGIYLPQNEALVGPQTVEYLKDIHVDKVFFGADGVTLTNGVTAANILEADVDHYMVQASKEVIVVADSSKIGVIGLVALAALDKVNTLVTDVDAPVDFVEAARNLGVKVILV